jgi:transcriptional regulator with XRE-family HTH domain
LTPSETDAFRCERLQVQVDRLVGQRVEEARIAAGLSLERLAAALHITAKQLAAYEAGRARISPAHLTRIAMTLGVSLVTFFPDAEKISQRPRND